MNRDVLETQWPQIREILSEKFSNLTDEDIRQINGRYDQLVAKLQQKYGYSREEAEERIRSWNFDRSANVRNQNVREDRRDDRVVRKDEDNSSILKWLLAIALPLLLLGAYFLNKTPETVNSPAYTHEQNAAETPADRSISTNLRNALNSQQNLTPDMQNVQVTTQDGIVTLSGFVSSSDMRDLIGRTAQNFTGVKRVNNDLQVR